MLFCATVHNVPRDSLVYLGGRQLNSYCRLIPSNRLQSYGYTYHTVASAKGSRIELRFPRPTTDHERIKRIVEFADVVERFASKAAPLKYQYDTSAIYADFVKYASKTKKGKLVLGYLNGTNEKDKETISKDSDSSALPAQPVGYSIAPVLRNTGEIFTLIPRTTTVSVGGELGELSASSGGTWSQTS